MDAEAFLEDGVNALQKALTGLAKVKVFNSEDFETDMDKYLAPGESKIKKAIPPHSSDCRYEFDSMDDEIASSVDSCDFWTYCKTFLPKKKSWGKVLSADQVLSFSKSMSGTIQKLNDEIKELAEKNFKRITYIMTESLTKAQVIDLIKKMIKAGIKNADELKNEFYMQIIKQIRNNTSAESQYQGWAILASYACFFAPSEDLCHPILNYLKFIANNHPDDEIQVWARFSFSRILNCFVAGPRQTLASTFELEYIRDHRKIPFTISFCSRGSIEVFVENYQTVGDLKDIVIEKLGLDKEKRALYGFMEQTFRPDRIEECFVEDFVNVCDIISSWEHESYFYRKTNGGTPYIATFKLCFKLKHGFPLEEGSNLELNMHYNESCYLFRNLHYESSFDDLIMACALDLQIRCGDWNEDLQTYIVDSNYDRISNFRCKFEEERTEEQCIEALSEKYQSLSGKKRNEAKKEFTDLVKSYDKMGYVFFNVKIQESSNLDEELPERMIVGLREDGMTFFDTHYKLVKKMNYNEIFKWGYSETTMVLLYGTEDTPSKLVFRTFQGTALVHTMTSFVGLQIGKNPKPNLLVQTNMRHTNREKVFFKRVSIFVQFKAPEEVA